MEVEEYAEEEEERKEVEEEKRRGNVERIEVPRNKSQKKVLFRAYISIY